MAPAGSAGGPACGAAAEDGGVVDAGADVAGSGEDAGADAGDTAAGLLAPTDAGGGGEIGEPAGVVVG